MKSSRSCVILKIMCGVIITLTVDAQNRTDVENLYSRITTSYNRFTRPSFEMSVRNEISMEFYLGLIRDIDELSGLFSVTGYMNIYWNDDRFVWDTNQYNGLSMINFPQSVIWKPDITLGNPFSTVKQLGYNDIMIRVSPDGTVTWMVGDTFEVTCDINIQYFPFDQQKCSLRYVIWGYTSSQVILKPTDQKVVLDKIYFQSSPEWVIIATDAYTDSSVNYPAIEFTVTMRRRYEYFILNVFVPIILLTMLSSMSFCLHTETGERVGYSITCLLAISVYLTILSDSLPKSSNPMSILGIFLIMDFLLSTGICICTILSIYIYHKGDSSDVPRWIQKIMACVHCMRCRRKKKDGIENSSTQQKPNSPILCSFKNLKHYTGEDDEHYSDTYENKQNSDDLDHSRDSGNSTMIQSLQSLNVTQSDTISNRECSVTIDISKSASGSVPEVTNEDAEGSRVISLVNNTNSDTASDVQLEDYTETAEPNTNEMHTDSSSKKDLQIEVDTVQTISDSKKSEEEMIYPCTWKQVSYTFDISCFVIVNATNIVLVVFYIMFSNLL